MLPAACSATKRRIWSLSPPPPEAADDDDGQSRVRVPEIYEIYAPDWQRFDFTDASVAQAEESLDDYSLFVNMDNRHLRRLLTTTDYQAAGAHQVQLLSPSRLLYVFAPRRTRRQCRHRRRIARGLSAART